jgi:hypothetical protein
VHDQHEIRRLAPAAAFSRSLIPGICSTPGSAQPTCRSIDRVVQLAVEAIRDAHRGDVKAVAREAACREEQRCPGLYPNGFSILTPSIV